MEIFHDLAAWRQVRDARPHHETLGFVPTMGNLHAGHLSLITRSQQENTDTLVSLFINPTQFNKPDDFTHYPRTLAADLAYLENAGVRYCFIPSADAIYADDYNYQIHEIQLSNRLEGLHRPGHFTGVLTVVMKLLQIARPHHAYFGEKDYQQFQLIRAMVSAFFMAVEVKACPTIRESSGLAYSSRNNRLGATAKAQAIQFANLFHQATSCETAITALQAIGIDVEYIAEQDNRRFAAVVIDGVRLIDNYALDPLGLALTSLPLPPKDA